MFTFPLSDQDLVLYIEDPKKVYDINYNNNLGKNGVVYLSNLDIKCNLKFSSWEDKSQFIKAYMTSPSLCYTKNVEKMVIKILLLSNNIKLAGFKADISTKEAEAFIKENPDIIVKYRTFLSSLIVFAFSTFTATKEIDPFEGTEIIDDPSYIGINVVNLLSYEELYFYYLTVNLDTAKNFIHQFNDYMFAGRNLYSYFYTDNNRLEQFISYVYNFK